MKAAPCTPPQPKLPDPTQLWAARHRWTPIPTCLLTEQSTLKLTPETLTLLLALIGLAHGRPDWPVVKCSWSRLALATGLSKPRLKRYAKQLRELGLLDYWQPTDPKAMNRWTLEPLQFKLSALHQVTHSVPKRVPPDKTSPPRLFDPDTIADPPTAAIAELARLSLAAAAKHAPWRLDRNYTLTRAWAQADQPEQPQPPDPDTVVNARSV